MTDRLKGVHVVFDRDIRTDDAEHMISVIRQMRNVAAVEPQITNIEDYYARARVKDELRAKILVWFKDLDKP